MTTIVLNATYSHVVYELNT